MLRYFEEATPAQAGTALANAKVVYGVAPEVGAGLAKPWTLVVPKGQAAAVKTEVHSRAALSELRSFRNPVY